MIAADDVAAAEHAYSIIETGQVLVVRHPRLGDRALGRTIVCEMFELLDRLTESGGRAACYHDSLNIETVDYGYTVEFAKLGNRYGDRVMHVAAVDKPWLRVLGRAGAILGGVDTKFAPTEEAALKVLASAGFDLELS